MSNARKLDMESEVHLFIIWEHARSAEQKIIKDIQKKFTILKIYEVCWSREKFTENLSRFYGTSLPPNSSKEKHCGTGPFLAIIVSDKNPAYKPKITSGGEKIVNTNLFDSKALHREWTGGGHRIHGSNTTYEANHNLTMLFGKNIVDLLKDASLGHPNTPERYKKDLVGSHGWHSLKQLLYVLNSTIDYVILRNFDPIPDNYYAKNHGDIDLLVSNYREATLISNSKPVFRPTYRRHHVVTIDNQDVFFDFRSVGDNYYDESWEYALLKSRKINERNFYVPSKHNYFYSLLYHALIHKPALGEDYVSIISESAKSIGIELDRNSFTSEQSVKILSNFLLQNNYGFTQPHDKSVYTNVSNIKKGRTLGVRFIKKNRTPLRNHLKTLKSRSKHYTAKSKRILKRHLKKYGK